MIKYKIFRGSILIFTLLLNTNAFPQNDPVERLNQSPRHHEWVDIQQGDRIIHTFVVYPQVSEDVPAVILIHENRGLTEWVRGLADQVAEAGYIAVAPDLLSGQAPGGGKTADFANSNAARDALYQLPPDQVTGDLKAVASYAQEMSAANGKLAVAGFCWGGSQTFRFATNYDEIDAAFVFYGTAPEKEAELKHISAPVYGFYGENDNRVTSTVKATEQKMDEAGKNYYPEVYDEAGHGFMRSGENAPEDNPNRQARDAAWERWMTFLEEL